MIIDKAFLDYFSQWEDKIGAFLQFNSEDGSLPGALRRAAAPVLPALEGGEAALGLIRGLPFAVKDNIAVEGLRCTCGSRLLSEFRSPYTATAVQALVDAGAWVLGKTNLDEFGMGSSTDSSALKRTNNPWDQSRVAGGSSGGSAAAVAAGLVPFALGSDTGGSVRQPAAFCGVLGLKPSYGAVSRFGLVAYASSLESIGILSDTVARCRAVFSIIRGEDKRDQSSRAAPAQAAAPAGAAPSKGRIAVLSPQSIAKAVAAGITAGDTGSEAALKIAAEAAVLEREVEAGFRKAQGRLSALGYDLEEVELPILRYGVPAYYTIAAAEASANLARFDGVRYGLRPEWAENPDDLVHKTRDEGFGAEVKLRILLGTFVLRSGFQDRYYLKAQRLRAAIRRHFEALLGGSEYAGAAPPYRAVLMPVFPTRAFDRSPSSLSPFAQKAADLYTCCANLAGLPALSFPASVEGGLPVGVQLLGRYGGESALLDIAADYEAAHPFPHPAGYKSFWREA
jgi:aspartyl-tRNA(Asn)/glutamyl-tRNA(Gln) amidotransferase subunit A